MKNYNTGWEATAPWALEDGGGAENKVQSHMVGCIINPYPENNAVRKFEPGRRPEREREHLLGKVEKENRVREKKKKSKR